jgi:hypothetical protein
VARDELQLAVEQTDLAVTEEEHGSSKEALEYLRKLTVGGSRVTRKQCHASESSEGPGESALNSYTHAIKKMNPDRRKAELVREPVEDINGAGIRYVG